MKKILLITTTPFYKEKGSSLRIYEIAKILGKKYKVDLVTYSTGEYKKIPNVSIYRTTSFFKPSVGVNNVSFGKFFLDFLVFIKSFSLLFKNNYNIIHCEDFEAALIGRCLTLFFKGKFFVYDLHNRILDNLELKRKVRNKILRKLILNIEYFIVKKCDLIILNWNKYSDDLIFKNKKTILFYDQINTESIEEYPIPKEKYLIYSGNFEPYQGLKEFLQVFKNKKTSYKLILIGEFSKEIENYIKENSLTTRVILTGRLSISQSNYLIQNSIAGILPRIEGSSMKVIHYLMLNKPVIATLTRSNEELLVDNYNGYLYKDSNSLENILDDVSINKNLNEGISKTKEKLIYNANIPIFLKSYEQS